MINIDPEVISFFTIPLSFFGVIISVLLIQWGMVNILSSQIGRISFNHKNLSKIMNWWGIFIHESSHAITAIVTFNKVTEFKVTSTGGYVVHENRGRFGFFQWLAIQLISISPAFVPPVLVVIFLGYLGYLNIEEILINLTDPVSIMYSLYIDIIPFLVKEIGWIFIDLNYTKVENTLLLVVLTFSFSSAYPSSMSGKRSQGDVQSLLQMFIKFPGYTLLFFLLCFFFFWILYKYSIVIFMNTFIFLILLPIMSIFGLVFNFLFIKLINLFDESSRFKILFALLASILVYSLMLKYNSDQYLINIAAISVLAVTLKLSR